MNNLSNTIKAVSIAFLLLVAVAEEEESSRMAAIIDATKSLFSLSSTATADYSNWLRRKAYEVFRWPPYTSPTAQPNLDFRDEGGEATTDKVKEAVVKSLDKSKAAVEDSAKSAAEFAEDAVDNTVKKLKDTFSPAEL